MKLTYKSCLSLFVATLCAAPVHAEVGEGNRYNLSPRLYDSEVSAAKAYILTNYDRGNKRKDEYANAILLDVRRVEEHVAGHPPGSYSIPFPHITGSPKCANDDGVTPCANPAYDPTDPNSAEFLPPSGYIGYDVSVDQEIGFRDPDMNDGTIPIGDYVAYVESVIRDKDTPILTLCATGYRSVQVANALVKYGNYTNVRNIWEGFNGQKKYAYDRGNIALDENGDPIPLDLNNDGVADNDDRDGWAYFQELPVSTKIHPKKIDADFADLYYQ